MLIAIETEVQACRIILANRISDVATVYAWKQCRMQDTPVSFLCKFVVPRSSYRRDLIKRCHCFPLRTGTI
jgi:hypothetical protein